jgi:opacity protein-like surface antigen
MTGRRFILLLLPVIFIFTVPAHPQQTVNELSFSAGRSDLNQLGDAPALGISYNRYWSGAASTRFGIHAAGENFGAEFGEVMAGAAHVSFEYHFRRSEAISPYAGAGVAVTHTRLSSFSQETNLAPIFSGGIDLKVTPRVAVSVDARFLRYEFETNDRFLGPLTLNPLTVMLSAKVLY